MTYLGSVVCNPEYGQLLDDAYLFAPMGPLIGYEENSFLYWVVREEGEGDQ